MLRPPVRPSRALAPRPLPLLRPLSTYSRVRPAWSGSNTAACGLAGLAVVAAAFPLLRYHQARGFSASSPLHCDEERKPTAREGDKGLFSSLPSVALPDLSLPKLPELPTIPTIDLNLSSWTDSFKPLQLLTDLQRELTAGEGSTLAKILASREDAELNPEVAWDAQVRLSTELGHAERAFLRVRKEAALKPFARLMGVEESEVMVEDIPVIAIAGSGGGYRGGLGRV